ncbi:hypothetical protein [Burkholderia lata]|uniref:hypothetical protein n=1 Tax=Burkholderia lata (strain ATCC 17760 / DSM 23089 / LMG 22485 / NCIMB 9086 / R18194 / 383) TaxID=482957 RepID=UPI001583A008|nr:hypothetical protein [Burkholderia lata]
MFKGISGALRHIDRTIDRAVNEVRVSAQSRPMQGPFGLLSALASQARGTSTGASQPRRSPLPDLSAYQWRPGPAPVRSYPTEPAARPVHPFVGPVFPFAPVPPPHQPVAERMPVSWHRPAVHVPGSAWSSRPSFLSGYASIVEGRHLPTVWRPAASGHTAFNQARRRGSGDLQPPASLAEEDAQLRLALEQSRTEALLKRLPVIDGNFDAAATADETRITDWDDLGADMRQVYPDKLAYYREVTATQVTTSHIQRAVNRAGTRAIPNDGRTSEGSNNCFLIALLQHATGDYRSSHAARVDQYRTILSAASHLDLVGNEKISAGSRAARALVDLINSDPGVQPKLSVEVVSELNGVVHRDRLGSSAMNARTVVIWDKGGHFEAVA